MCLSLLLFCAILSSVDLILLVDKPKGITSSRVVELIKRKIKVKVGHTGTLDPLATGLLIILTGKRTREAASFLNLDKSYLVKAILGMETDTFDLEGRIVQRSDKEVTEDELKRAIEEFHGDIWQKPPPYSSKKIRGKKAYELARKGELIEIPSKKVHIYSLEFREFQYPYFTLSCDVSSGFYVRSLVHDIGEKLGVGATVIEVRRVSVGPYHVEQAKEMDKILE